jgi:hypothetical protein
VSWEFFAMRRAIIVFALAVAASAARAQVGARVDEITVAEPGGRVTFKSCVVTKVEPDGVRVAHEYGIAKIPYEAMPEAWKATMHHTDAAAAAFREQSAKLKKVPVSKIAKEEEEMAALDHTSFGTGTIITKEDVVKAWIAQSNPDNVSDASADPKSSQSAGGGSQSSWISKSTLVSATDVERLKKSMARHQQALLAGKYDRQAEVAALSHDLPVYESRGDAEDAAKCKSRLSELGAAMMNDQ